MATTHSATEPARAPTLEDTATTPAELVAAFGAQVAGVVTEVTDETGARERRTVFLDSGAAVVAALHGLNPALDAEFDRVRAEGQARLASSSH